MNKTVNAVTATPMALWRGAPVPLIIRNRNTETGLYEAFAATLAFRVKVRGVDAFTLTVGAGITLDSHNGVGNAKAVILPSEAQSLMIPKGSYAAYELTEGAVGSRSLVLAGPLEGQGT